jgi:L-threonylcarbamoyladenylate synthase
METKLLPINDPYALAQAIDILAEGGLVAFPTDTVYGLGALAFNEMAVAKLYEAKGYDDDRAFPILLADFEQINRVALGVNSLCQKLARRFWPGPLTILVPRHPGIPDAVTPFSTVGVRIPDFEPTRELLRLTGPLAVTSANRAGRASASTALGVLDQFEGRIPLILEGGVTPGGVPSTIVDCTSGEPQIVREGPITFEQIINALA